MIDFVTYLHACNTLGGWANSALFKQQLRCRHGQKQLEQRMF